MARFITTLCLLALFALSTQAQDRFAFDPDITYDADIPSPASFLGYELGNKFTFHAHMLDYVEAVAEASDRVTLHDYGHSHEGRRLVYLVITSPDNHTNIESIRQNNLRLADPGDSEADGLMADHPVVHWMSYNVHGNEPSSTETAMQVVYRLAAGQDNETLRMLDEAVTIIDPCLNPDGRDRYTYWYSTMHSKLWNTSPDDIEHNEPWPGGRTNHYWFDLNRDWVWLVHPESQGRLKAYQQWLPQVHIDYHEQGYNTNYFTHPGTTPRNLNLPPAYFEWEEAYGKGDADAFDAHKISYFTKEAFDFYYPGYGSSYPSLMGAIGQLREQGGHSRGGRAVKTEDGYVLTLRQRIFDHYLTSFAGIKTSIDNRGALLQYFRDAFNPSETNQSDTEAYILPNNSNDYTYRIIRMLMEHGVEVHQADADFTVADARGYWDDGARSQNFEAGDFVINANQPRHLFVNTLLQRQMVIEDSIMYDMATWSVPQAYNLQNAAWTEQAVSVAKTLVTEPPMKYGSLANAEANYAYIIEWSQETAPRALAMLWEAGYRVRSIQRTFELDGKTYDRGTLVVLTGRNLEKADLIAADMDRIAREAGVHIEGFDSGWTDAGINLASRWSTVLKKPTVGLLVDSPFNSYTAGQLWFLFEEWTGLRVNRLRIDDLRRIELSDYDVLVMPGAFGGLSQRIDSAGVAMLRRWIQEGGTLVGTEGSALFLTKDQSRLTGIERAKEEEDDKKEDEDEVAEEGTVDDPYVGREDRRDLRDLENIPGSALRSFLDPTHPLTYGMPEQLFSLKFGSNALEPSTSAEVAGYYHKDASQVLASGYISVDNREKLAGKAFAMTQRLGSGSVVLLLDNTQYRMFWVGPTRMMQNAVMLVPGM